MMASLSRMPWHVLTMAQIVQLDCERVNRTELMRRRLQRVLMPGNAPGQCLPLNGSSGHVILALRAAVCCLIDPALIDIDMGPQPPLRNSVMRVISLFLCVCLFFNKLVKLGAGVLWLKLWANPIDKLL